MARSRSRTSVTQQSRLSRLHALDICLCRAKYIESKSSLRLESMSYLAATLMRSPRTSGCWGARETALRVRFPVPVGVERRRRLIWKVGHPFNKTNAADLRAHQGCHPASRRVESSQPDVAIQEILKTSIAPIPSSSPAPLTGRLKTYQWSR